MPCDHTSGCPIRGAQQGFRARIAAEIERGEEFLLDERSTDDEKAAHVGVTLGAFAGGRIDSARFSSLLSAGRNADAATIGRVEAAVAVLRELGENVDEYTKVAVPPSGALRDTVATALDQIGRVFGAARVIELARTDRYVESEHARYLRGLRHASWSAAERAVAPWMRVVLRGDQLHAGVLAEYLDGGLKIVLKPQGACPPAPLAILATPGVYVAQVAGKADLEGFKAFGGPAVALVAGEGAALFVHDPGAGAQPWDRVTVVEAPERVRQPIGGISIAQMNEGVAQLQMLACRPATTSAGDTAPANAAATNTAAAAEPADPADRLAAWLLGQAGLAAGQAPAKTGPSVILPMAAAGASGA